MKEGGPFAWSILAVMVIMSVGSFYILVTKLFEQNKIMKQYKAVQTTSGVRAASRKGDQARKGQRLAPPRRRRDPRPQEEHGKMTDSPRIA